jgi:hypothetical protein
MEYRLRIDAYTPTTIPMGRLAEYMADFAALLGEKDSVHFVRLDGGSTVLVSEAEREAEPKILHRLDAIRNREAPQEVLEAYSRIDERLVEDNATGDLETGEGAHILFFPGRERPPHQEYGSFAEAGTIQGQIIMVGGKRDRVSVHIQEGTQIWLCHAMREVARRMAQHIFGPAIRAIGVGRWERDRNGRWRQMDFVVKDFENLNDEPLPDVVKKLQAIEADWKTSEDPLRRLGELRSGEDS